jgi:hypothetical protein
MRFDHEGMSLWYGTEDTPAPGDTVQEDTPITITIGVKPTDASNRIELLHRSDGGSMDRVHAKWLRNDQSSKIQYFRASLPPFHAGDRVEYLAICTCAGRQVPPCTVEEYQIKSFHSQRVVCLVHLSSVI